MTDINCFKGVLNGQKICWRARYKKHTHSNIFLCNSVDCYCLRCAYHSKTKKKEEKVNRTEK